VPRPFPREFREDMIGVARNREPGVRIKDVAADFGISESCLQNCSDDRAPWHPDTSPAGQAARPEGSSRLPPTAGSKAEQLLTAAAEARRRLRDALDDGDGS